MAYQAGHPMKRLYLLPLLLLSMMARAQNTQVSATLTDPNSLPIQNCVYTISLVSSTGQDISTSPVFIGGIPFNDYPVSGNCDAFGHFSVPILSNTSFTAPASPDPTGTQYKFSIQSQASPPNVCPQRAFSGIFTVTGTTLNLTSGLSALAPVISCGGGGSSGGPFTNLLVNATRASSRYSGPVFNGVTPDELACGDTTWSPTFPFIACQHVNWLSYGSGGNGFTEGDVNVPYGNLSVNNRLGTLEVHSEFTFDAATGDDIHDTVYHSGAAANYFDSDQAFQTKFFDGGAQLGTPHFVIATGGTATQTPTFTTTGIGCISPGFDPCLPNSGTLLTDEATAITGRYTGPSQAFVGPAGACATISWLRVLPTTATFPTASAFGCAFGVNIITTTTQDVPIPVTIPLQGGTGSFSVGDHVVVAGSNFAEQSVITGVSGSSPTQTIVLPLTKNNHNVSIFKGGLQAIEFDADAALPGNASVKTSYLQFPSLSSIGASYQIYAVEALSLLGIEALPIAGAEPEVVAPNFATSTVYAGALAFTYVWDGANVQAISSPISGTCTSAGTAPTWNATLGGTTTSNDCTFTNKGPISGFHVYPAARTVWSKPTCDSTTASYCVPFVQTGAPTVKLEPNPWTWTAGDPAYSLQPDVQHVQGDQTVLNQNMAGNAEGNLQGQVEQFGGMGAASDLIGHTVYNTNPQSYYYQGGGTMAEPLTGYDTKGYWLNINSTDFAPGNSLFNVGALQPGQTSFGLLSFNSTNPNISFIPSTNQLVVGANGGGATVTLGGSANALTGNGSITLSGGTSFVDSPLGYKVNGGFGTSGQCLTTTGTANLWAQCVVPPGSSGNPLFNSSGSLGADTGSTTNGTGTWTMGKDTIGNTDTTNDRPLVLTGVNTTDTAVDISNQSNGSPIHSFFGVAGSGGYFSAPANAGFLGISGANPVPLWWNNSGLNIPVPLTLQGSLNGCLFATSGVVTATGCGGSGAWSALTNPTGNLALTMGSYSSTFTYGATTGSGDLMKWTDTPSNTGTGILGHFTTASGSAESPWAADANGVGCKVDATGRFVCYGSSLPASVQYPAGSGTLPALTANSFGWVAPVTGGTSYLIQPPATITAGIVLMGAPTSVYGVNVAQMTIASAKGTFVCTGGGTITISNAAELATSDVIISMNTAGGTITTSPAMKTVTPGTGFSVLCGATDTSTYNYNILP